MRSPWQPILLKNEHLVNGRNLSNVVFIIHNQTGRKLTLAANKCLSRLFCEKYAISQIKHKTVFPLAYHLHSQSFGENNDFSKKNFDVQ